MDKDTPVRPKKNIVLTAQTTASRQPFFTRWFWIWFGLIGIVPLIGFIAGSILFFQLSKSLPSLENLEKIAPPLISKVYDKDSVLIHEFFTERRIWTEYADIPEKIKQAIMAIEDRKFENHWGVNLQAYPSALLPVLFGKRARGASTVTQQLAKNLFLTPERKITRKLKELILAINIEKTYTKAEIMEFYINQVYLGAGAYGFQSAAQKYFSRPLDSLQLHQYALLAGLLQRPERYRPDRHPERSKIRRNIVLAAMRQERFITKAEMVEAKTQPTGLNLWSQNSLKAPYFVETIRQFLEEKWGEEFIYQKGVHVYSTLDDKIQHIADTVYQNKLEKIRRRLKYKTARGLSMHRYLKMPIDTVVAHFDSIYPVFQQKYIYGSAEKKRRARGDKPLFPDSLHYQLAQAAVIVIENKTGAVRALIGGDNFETSKFNRALQAVRLPGSSFKPIVYTAAIDNGASPLDSLNDQPITIPDPKDTNNIWRPKNYDGKFSGNIALRRAFYKSKNLPAIKLAMQYGLKTVVSYARRFGLKHRIPSVPSLGIGTCEATLMEMTSAYTVFPNGGIRVEPYFIDKIDDKNGRLIHRSIPISHETIKPTSAYIMTSLMKDVNIRGTGAAIWAGGFDHPSGGKTGTTNRETDAWYIGYTRHFTTGVWVGSDNNKPLGRGHTGSRNAVPIWLGIMKEIHKDLRKRNFSKPAGVFTRKICKISGELAGALCSQTAEDYFTAASAPDTECDGKHNNPNLINNTGDAFSSKRQRYKVHQTEEKQSPRVRNVF